MDLTITYFQGQTLLGFINAGAHMPEKFGAGETAETFDVAERGFLDDQIRKFRKVLVSYCHHRKETKQILFGDRENWTLKSPEFCANPNCGIPLNGRGKELYEMKDKDEFYKIKIDEDDEKEGLYWTLVLMAHPGSPFLQSIQTREDIVWPLAKMIEADKQLVVQIKLDKRKGRKILWNNSKEWSKRREDDSKKIDLAEDKKSEMASNLTAEKQ